MSIASPKSGQQLLDLYEADMRSHLLEVAAAFDRLERAGLTGGERLERLRRAAALAVGTEPDRARRLLESLSVP